MPYVSYTDFGTYAQDTWRITPRLTAVFGLRYDLFTSPIDRKNRISNFVPDGGTISQVSGGTGQVVIADQGKYSRAIIQTRKLNFTPRVSLAYKLGTSTVLRSAFGAYFFDEQGTGSSARLFLNYPFAQTFSTTCSSTVTCLSTLIPASHWPFVEQRAGGRLLSTAKPNSLRQPVNLTLEHQVTNSLAVRGSYVDRRTHSA